MPRAWLPARLASDVRDRDGDDRPGPVGEARRDPLRARVADVRDDDGRLAAGPPAACAGSSARTRRRRRRSSAKTSGWSHSADVRTASAGRYGSKLPAYSSASTTNGGVRPAATRRRRDAAGQRRAAAARRRTRTGRGRPRRGRGRASPRSCSCRASRRRRRGAGPPPRPRRPAATARAGCRAARGRRQLGMVRRDRGQGLRHREPVRAAAPGPRRGPDRAPRRSGCRRRRGPRVYGDGPPGSQPLTSAPAQRRGRAAALAPAPAMPDDVDPLARPDRAERSRAGARPAPMRRGARSPRASPRSRWRRPARAAAPGPRPRSRPCSRPGRRTRGDRRTSTPVGVGHGRRTSARPASPRSRRRGRRSP